MRCPVCSKLYKVEPEVLALKHSQFDCLSCHQTFAFEYPSKHPNSVKTFVIDSGFSKPAAVEVKEVRESTYQGLARMWQELMNDYGNLTKHFAFVERCEELQAIPFALKKYENLKRVQPQDDLANQMFHQVLMKSLVTTTEKIMNQNEKLRMLSKQISSFNWQRLQKILPLAIGILLVSIGLSNANLRNLIGAGAAIIVATGGFRIFKSGEFRLKDYV
jgi:hypothetical protein